MTNEEMATILDHFHNGYPVEVSRDEAQALMAGAAALRAVAKLEHLAESERGGVLTRIAVLEAERDQLLADNDRLRLAAAMAKAAMLDYKINADVDSPAAYTDALEAIAAAISAPPPDAVKRYEARVKAEVLYAAHREICRAAVLAEERDAAKRGAEAIEMLEWLWAYGDGDGLKQHADRLWDEWSGYGTFRAYCEARFKERAR